MSMFDEIFAKFAPHSERLNQTIHLQGAALHTKLAAIEKAVSDLGRPDFGDLWADIGVNKNMLAKTPVEIGTVQMNEVLEVQAFAASGAAAVKRVNLRANGRLRASLPISEAAPGFVGVGANITFLPGESITLEAEAEGQVEATVTCVRRGLPMHPRAANTGVSGELDSGHNTHDMARDIIRSRTGGYAETAGERPGPVVSRLDSPQD